VFELSARPTTERDWPRSERQPGANQRWIAVEQVRGVQVKRLQSRRLWLVLAILVGLILVGHWLDRPQPIEGYRLVDDRTIGVEVDASSPQWTRVTGVTETSDRVTVSVGSFIFPWPQGAAGVGTSEELLVTLSQPLGSRSVIDGNTGDTVERVQCALGRCAASGRMPRTFATNDRSPGARAALRARSAGFCAGRSGYRLPG
jgi:hypothetical protein